MFENMFTASKLRSLVCSSISEIHINFGTPQAVAEESLYQAGWIEVEAEGVASLCLV